MRKFLFCIVTTFLFCHCEKPISPSNTTPLLVQFEHSYNGQTILFDTLLYKNEATNTFLINEIKYFICDLVLFKDGIATKVRQDDGIWYVDSRIDSTLEWKIKSSLEQDSYDSIAFTFGLSPSKNLTNLFVNPPQNAMAWPQVLGGGYHHMMINGKYDNNDTLYALNLHLGTGQIYRGTDIVTDSIVGFVNNDFTVGQPLRFDLEANKTCTLTIEMKVENFFKNPHTYDFLYWGGHIMQKQAAMQMLIENGKKDVFVIHHK